MRQHRGLVLFLWHSYNKQFQLRQAISVHSCCKINSDLWLPVMSSSTAQSTTTNLAPKTEKLIYKQIIVIFCFLLCVQEFSEQRFFAFILLCSD